ncbi:unnamed protein product [Blepharisma stoltei]|uniref:IBR domain-containing protein n=1 Tax=Blepharisma stoltei TaxID=1481888 RepID=A0AAU9JKA4_9CILI|nr:unnamed protein product [Blepharisma stoltei]
MLRDIEIPSGSNSFLFYCPGRDCESICIIDNGVKEFICPLCHFQCCPSCNKDIHNGKTCEEYANNAK